MGLNTTWTRAIHRYSSDWGGEGHHRLRLRRAPLPACRDRIRVAVLRSLRRGLAVADVPTAPGPLGQPVLDACGGLGRSARHLVPARQLRRTASEGGATGWLIAW